ncbi:MAG TPA: hypothetical protein VMJ93_05865 [Verrucomicrobiae bacterium]|nr:hypothetical protein [Verrucomicrobiae bacterium]
MKKRVGIWLTVCACTVALSGCMFRSAGPCYGFGCPSMAKSEGAPPQNAMKGQGGTGAASNGAANATAQNEKPHGFVAFLKNLLPSHHVEVAPATTAGK